MWLLLAAHLAAAEPQVLFWADAELYTQPDPSAPSVRLDPKVDRSTELHAVRFATFVARRGPWVEIETSHYRGPCHPAASTNTATGVTLFVRPKDLVQGVTRPVDLKTASGTRVHLDPGLAAHENSDHSWTVAVSGLQIKARLPEGAVGETWEPVAGTSTDFRPTHGATGTFGDDELTIQASGAPAAQAGTTWHMERRCAIVDGPHTGGDPPQEGAAARPDQEVPAVGRGDGTGQKVAPGATLYWPDGVYAGSLDIRLMLRNDKKPNPDGLVCGPFVHDLRVCVADPAAATPPVPRYLAPDLEAKEKVAPKLAKGAPKDLEGKCRCAVDVGPAGAVQSVTPGNCAPEIADAAKEAIQQWTFTPLRVDGKAVPARTWVSVEI